MYKIVIITKKYYIRGKFFFEVITLPFETKIKLSNMLSTILNNNNIPYVLTGLPIGGTLVSELIFRTQKEIDSWYKVRVC